MNTCRESSGAVLFNSDWACEYWNTQNTCLVEKYKAEQCKIKQSQYQKTWEHEIRIMSFPPLRVVKSWRLLWQGEMNILLLEISWVEMNLKIHRGEKESQMDGHKYNPGRAHLQALHFTCSIQSHSLTRTITVPFRQSMYFRNSL